MRFKPCHLVLVVALYGGDVGNPVPSRAGDLIVDLGKPRGVTLLGAINRWDQDGNARVPVDPKAKIDGPRVDARAEPGPDGRWTFRNLAEGRYDLVILTDDRVRVEGFAYPPINEFDRFLPRDAQPPDEDTRGAIVKDIARSRHYENKVAPLFLAGDEKQVRVLVQLVRDQPTSFDGDFGDPAATIRHEVWQYTNNYGGWVKERRTKVLDRLIMARGDLHRWTWIWTHRLGGIEVGRGPVTVSYDWPERFDPRTERGWFRD
jgi:hypothetical protein